MEVGFIFTSFALYFVFSFFAIFFASVNVFAGSSLVSLWFFGITSVCPYEIGLISRIATLSLFWSICIDGDCPFAIAQKVHTGSLGFSGTSFSFISGAFCGAGFSIGRSLISFAILISSS